MQYNHDYNFSYCKIVKKIKINRGKSFYLQNIKYLNLITLVKMLYFVKIIKPLCTSKNNNVTPY